MLGGVYILMAVMFEQSGADDAIGLASEKLLLHPVRAHHCGRKDHERSFRSRAPVVDHAGSDFLADAGGPGDEDAAPGRSDSLQCRANGVDRNRCAVKLLFMLTPRSSAMRASSGALRLS